MVDKKKQKKKPVPKKQVSKSKSGVVAKASVVVNIGGKSGGKSQSKKKTMIKGTPEEFRKSSGYILPQYSQPTIIQSPPSTVQYLPAPTTNQYLFGEKQKQITYPQQQQITFPEQTDKGHFSVEEPKATEDNVSVISEVPSFNIEDVSQPENVKAPSLPKSGTTRVGGNIAKTEEEKLQISRDKLSNYGFPDKIANKGTVGRDSDIDAVVQIMYNANQQGAGITAADLNRVYGIDGGSVKVRLEKITGIKQIGRRKPVSKIPTLEEYNLK